MKTIIIGKLIRDFTRKVMRLRARGHRGHKALRFAACPQREPTVLL